MQSDSTFHTEPSVDYSEIERLIQTAWENREAISVDAAPESLRSVIKTVFQSLNEGHLRVCEKVGAAWQTHQWIKQAILLSFRLFPNQLISGGPQVGVHQTPWYDKVPLKFSNWTVAEFQKTSIRAVPGSIVRSPAYIGPDVVLMPCFINMGAWVGANTLVDAWSTIGSCAQIGKSCHISGGVGIGGVLEPLQANPVIIEDNCFIGARSEIAEGVIIEEGSVISMGTFLTASTKIIDRQTGQIYYGRVPAYSVVVPGSWAGGSAAPSAPALNCAVIIKQVDAKTRSKTSLNELLRS